MAEQIRKTGAGRTRTYRWKGSQPWPHGYEAELQARLQVAQQTGTRVILPPAFMDGEARPDQLLPLGDWLTWLILAGRGWGKTRTGAETIREVVEKGIARRIALVAPTPAAARSVMLKGESGLLAISPPWTQGGPKWNASQRIVTWPNGAQATVFSGSNPEQLRGEQHDFAWVDELCAFKYPDATWTNLLLGLRLGKDPRIVVTTTPKPTKLIRELLADSTTYPTRGTTYDNLANLPPAIARKILAKYEGTRLGRQELNAEILDAIEGALWSRDQIDADRMPAFIWEGDQQIKNPRLPDFKRLVVAIDPAMTSDEENDETGIIGAALGVDNHAYVLDDLSGHFSPDGWGKRAVTWYNEQHADRILGEVNNGGDMVALTIKAAAAALGVRNVAFKKVHASKGKRVRAEPVAALYEQHRVHHVGSLGALEDQQCVFLPEGGEGLDDRVDAAVYALTELMLTREYAGEFVPVSLTGKSKWR